MTKQMYEDFIKILKKRNKNLIIALCVAIALFIGMSIFAFSEFEIIYETETCETYDISQEVDNGEGGSNITSQNMSFDEEKDNTKTICITTIICSLIVVGGLIVGGTIKAKNKSKENE